MKITIITKKEKELKVPTIDDDYSLDEYECEPIRNILDLCCPSMGCCECILAPENVQDVFKHLKTLE